MTNSTINSGAINETPFPGAESGASLIELVGTVEVACSISAVTLRRLVQAVASASANGTAATVKKSRLGAAIVCTATPTVTARSKIPVIATTPATCASSATNRITFIFAASGSGVATTTPANGSIAVARSAFAEAGAIIFPAAAKTYAYRGATSTAGATGTVATLRKLAAYIEGAAIASNTAKATVRNRIGAQVSVVATGTFGTRVSITLQAITQAQALGTAPLYKKIPTGAYTPSLATCPPAGSVKGISFGATTQANALASATIRFKSVVSASVTATAIAQSTATDYATAMPAPVERTMTVQGFDRRMEATE